MKPTEFLNLDVILEGVMNRLVLKELREHVYSLLVDEYVNNGSIPSMVENIHYAKSKSIQDFAVRVSLFTNYLLIILIMSLKYKTNCFMAMIEAWENWKKNNLI